MHLACNMQMTCGLAPPLVAASVGMSWSFLHQWVPVLTSLKLTGVGRLESLPKTPSSFAPLLYNKTKHNKSIHLKKKYSHLLLSFELSRRLEPLFLMLLPSYLPLMAWLCNLGCTRHIFSCSLAPKAAEIPV